MTTSTIGVSLDKNTQHRLEALGKIRDQSPDYLMKVAVKRYLDVEEAERQIAKARLEEYKLTGEAIDQADVEKWAASLGQIKNEPA